MEGRKLHFIWKGRRENGEGPPAGNCISRFLLLRIFVKQKEIENEMKSFLPDRLPFGGI
jgi:hypothetical protein